MYFHCVKSDCKVPGTAGILPAPCRLEACGPRKKRLCNPPDPGDARLAFDRPFAYNEMAVNQDRTPTKTELSCAELFSLCVSCSLCFPSQTLSREVIFFVTSRLPDGCSIRKPRSDRYITICWTAETPGCRLEFCFAPATNRFSA